MSRFDSQNQDSPKQNNNYTIAGDTIYYDGRIMSKPEKREKVFMAVWAIATVVLLGYALVTNKDRAFVALLIEQAAFVGCLYMVRHCKMILLQPLFIIGMFVSFSLPGVTLSGLQETTNAESSGMSAESILIIMIFAVFLSMFSIGFTNQQYERKAIRECTVAACATVVRVKRSFVTLGKLNVPVLAYNFHGQRYETVYNRPLDFSKNYYEVGQTAIVKIDPSDPSNIFVSPQSFNQGDVQNPDGNTQEHINAIVDDFKRLYENPEQYYNESTEAVESYNQYVNQPVVTNTTYHNRKSSGQIKPTVMGYIFILWFVVSIIVGAVGARTNPFITLMAFGQIPLVMGFIVFFGIGKGTTKSPGLGGGMFFVGLVLVVIAGINMFGNADIKQLFTSMAPVLMMSVFNIAGMSLICVGPYFSYMNRKHHTESVTGYVIRLNHSVTSKERVGLVDIYAPIYGYTYRGKKYITESTVYSESDYPNEGSSRRIFINPDNPKEIYEPERSDVNMLIMILFGTVFSAFSLLATFLIVGQAV